MDEESEAATLRDNAFARKLLAHLYKLHVDSQYNSPAASPDPETLKAAELPDAEAFARGRALLFMHRFAAPGGRTDFNGGSMLGAFITDDGAKAQRNPGQVDRLFPLVSLRPQFIDDGALYVVIDTNCLIEFPLPRNIPWKKVLGGKKPIVIVITAAMLGELNNAKDNGKLPQRKRERAGKAIRVIETTLMKDHSGDPRRHQLNRGAEWMYEPSSPPADLFEQYGLERTVRDDVLAATVLHLRQTRDTCFVSDDNGARMRVRALKLRAESIPRNYRFKGVFTEDALREQLREVLDRMPKLVVRFADGTSKLAHAVAEPREPIAKYVQEETDRLQALLPKVDPFTLQSPELLRVLREGKWRGPTEYAGARGGYFSNLDNTLEPLIRCQNRLGLFVPLRNLIVVNEGKRHADNVEVYIHLPPELRNHGPSLLDARPIPTPPAPLQRGTATPKGDVDELLGQSVHSSVAQFKEPKWQLAKDGGQSPIRVVVGKLREEEPVPLPLTFLELLTFESVGSFKLRVVAYSDNAPFFVSEIALDLSKGPMRPLRLLSTDS